MRQTLRLQSADPFWWMLLLSLLLHGVLLALRFAAPALRESRQAPPPLEVVLVNSASASRPVKALALAQANLDGGGDTAAKVRATSPLPQLEQARPGTLVEKEAAVAQLEARARTLLAVAESRTVQVPLMPEAATAQGRGQAEPAQVPEMLRLKAEIEREWQAYQQRPRRRFIGASTQEYKLARYVEDWRARVEHLGNQHYPDDVKRAKAYGRVTLTVSIFADGRLEKVGVDRSSGSRLIDEAAVRLVMRAAPFAPFTPEMRQETDILSITRTFIFTRDDRLHSTS